MVSLLGLIEFLQALSHDPVAFSVVLYLYSVAATVFLPIPVEAGLFFSPDTHVAVKALVLGAGKATGSIIVFYLGDKIGGGLSRWSHRSEKPSMFSGFFKWMEKFVEKTRYFGLYLILSIPLMVDTVPLYLFAMFNRKGTMHLRPFVITNFLAGITRATIVLAVAAFFYVRLV